MNSGRSSWLFGAYVFCALAALVWPVLDWVGSEPLPLILGMPPTLAWHVAWVLIGFTALVLYDRSREVDP